MRRGLTLLALRSSMILLVLCLVVAPNCSSWCAAKACSLPTAPASSPGGCHHHGTSSNSSSHIATHTAPGFCPAGNDFPAALRLESSNSFFSAGVQRSSTDFLAVTVSSASPASTAFPSQRTNPLQPSREPSDPAPTMPLRL